jgi:hypothetical protein
MLERGISAYYAATDGTKSMDELINSCRSDLELCADKALRNWI